MAERFQSGTCRFWRLSRVRRGNRLGFSCCGSRKRGPRCVVLVRDAGAPGPSGSAPARRPRRSRSPGGRHSSAPFRIAAVELRAVPTDVHTPASCSAARAAAAAPLRPDVRARRPRSPLDCAAPGRACSARAAGPGRSAIARRSDAAAPVPVARWPSARRRACSARRHSPRLRRNRGAQRRAPRGPGRPGASR